MDTLLIHLDKNACKQCYACVRKCPVHAIKVEKNVDYPEVIHSRCIGCGNCLNVCSPGAITYQQDSDRVTDLLQSGVQVAALVAPSISAEFDDITDYRKFVEMIRALGFTYVMEASFGVDLVARKYKELFSDFKGKYYLTSNDPVVVAYIEKFHPELLDNLAPIVPPMAAAARVVHEKYGQDVQVVYIGPDIAAKMALNRFTGDAALFAAITFVELREMFSRSEIVESTREFSEFDFPLGYKGSLYPLRRGFLQAAGLTEDLLEGKVITAAGLDDMMEAVDQFSSYGNYIQRHFNLFSCEGMMMGPGMSKAGNKMLKRTLVTDYVAKRLGDFDLVGWQDDMEKYRDLDLSRIFVNDNQRLPMPPQSKVKEVLALIGKRGANDVLGCGSCGYVSCQHFAVAVAKGLAKPEMCLTYSLQNRQEYINTLKQTNQRMTQMQEALKSSEQTARNEQMLAREAKEMTSAMLQKLPSGVVIVDKGLKIIESNSSFIELLGEDAAMINDVIPGLEGADLKTLLPVNFYRLFSGVIKSGENLHNRDVHVDNLLLNVSVFTIRPHQIVGAVIRDMSSPEVQREEILHRLSEVIDQNLGMVQQIGFLLGEGASKTEKMLNSIIESYRSDKKR